jgi:hypothetical protein
MTLMSVLIMGSLLGPVGLLVAVPAIVVLDVIIRRILINRIYEGQGFRRMVRDDALVVRTPAAEAEVIVPDEVTDLLAGLEDLRESSATAPRTRAFEGAADDPA